MHCSVSSTGTNSVGSGVDVGAAAEGTRRPVAGGAREPRAEPAARALERAAERRRRGGPERVRREQRGAEVRLDLWLFGTEGTLFQDRWADIFNKVRAWLYGLQSVKILLDTIWKRTVIFFFEQ